MPFFKPIKSGYVMLSFFQYLMYIFLIFPVKDKFEQRSYSSITEFVADFRLMLENCYRYNGPDHYISKRGQKLETMLEQKLALLSRY